MELRNNFIKHIKNLNKNNDDSENKAYTKVIDNLFIKNLRG
jgi:hypothetical protein